MKTADHYTTNFIVACACDTKECPHDLTYLNEQVAEYLMHFGIDLETCISGRLSVSDMIRVAFYLRNDSTAAKDLTAVADELARLAMYARQNGSDMIAYCPNFDVITTTLWDYA